jgi:chromosome segregation ATPase
LREANQRNSSLNSQNSSLQGQLSSKTAEVAGKDTQIALINDNLKSTQKELEKKENQLVERDKRIETLGGLFNDLKIESNNKDKEIEKKDKNIEILEGKLDKSQEEVLNYKLREQERKMDELISQLGIRRVQVRELRIFYQKLIRARINYNETDINTADDKIETIKDELLDGGVSVENAQKLCRKSERIAKIRIEQGEIQKKQWQQQQQQYQAQQEQPTNNN